METIHFTTGLSSGVAWPWPIAVYLFLAGISGGAVAVGILLNLLQARHAERTPLLKAGSVLGIATILLGMLCLVCDLANPLNFWRILIYYNPTSVMSIGVMALLFYIPLLAMYAIFMIRDELEQWVPFVKKFAKILDLIERVTPALEWVVMVLALTICAYTGFLISALIRFPLINTAVLPALFVASGLSAGTSASSALAVLFFGDKTESHDQHKLHQTEGMVMIAEMLFLFMIAVSLVSGTAGGQRAFAAFTTGTWAAVFWIGAVGIGFGLPTVIRFIRSKAMAAFYASACASVIGMMCLRLFIIYAGQLNPMV